MTALLLYVVFTAVTSGIGNTLYDFSSCVQDPAVCPLTTRPREAHAAAPTSVTPDVPDGVKADRLADETAALQTEMVTLPDIPAAVLSKGVIFGLAAAGQVIDVKPGGGASERFHSVPPQDQPDT